MSDNAKCNLYALALANLTIWVIALIAMIPLLQQAQPVQGRALILMGGVGVGAALVAAILKCVHPTRGPLSGRSWPKAAGQNREVRLY